MRRLSRQTKLLLDKSTDSATQAVSVFNDPRSTFRTGNFSVLMTIAWTALLHSYFEKQNINYFYRQPNGRYIKIDGEHKAWELGESVKQVFSENDPIRKNIESWLVDKYGNKYSLIDTMFVPIQLTSSRRILPKTKTEQKVIDFIKNYRNLLAPEIINSQQFSFKAFLVPKIGNHRTSSDIAIEFVKYDENNPKEMEKYEKAIVAIKEKYVSVANTDLYRPSNVLVELNKRGIKKTMHWHTTMWQKYKVRPVGGVGEKTNTKSEYCVFDKAHGDYLYTTKWIDMLAKQTK